MNPVDSIPVINYSICDYVLDEDCIILSAKELVRLINDENRPVDITLCDVLVNGKGTYIQIDEIYCNWIADDDKTSNVHISDIVDLSADNKVEIYINKSSRLMSLMREYRKK